MKVEARLNADCSRTPVKDERKGFNPRPAGKDENRYCVEDSSCVVVVVVVVVLQSEPLVMLLIVLVYFGPGLFARTTRAGS